MTTFPIVALLEGEVLDPAWIEDITDVANDHQTRLETLETAPVLKAVGIRITNSSTTTTEIGVLRIDDIPILSGHRYVIETNSVTMHSTVTTDCLRMNIRYTTDGSTPTTSNTALCDAQLTVNNNSFPTTSMAKGSYVPGSNQTLSVLLTIQRITGTGNAQLIGSSTFPIELYISDLGPDTGDVGVDV